LEPDPLAELVSVVIPVFNGEQFLAEAIRSVLDQTYQPIQPIVVDDGSSDASVAIARSFEAVDVIEQEHRGPGAARNRGVAHSSGGFLAFLDADDVMPADKLERQVGYLIENPGVGCVLGRQELFGDGLSADWRDALSPPMWRHPELLDRGSLQPLSLVVRRSDFDSVGNFSTEFGEDIDWLCRAWGAGIGVHTVDAVVLRRRVHDGNLTRNIGASRRAMFRALRDDSARRRKPG
jgi:glycosyltransferase involved in cell wall biosynthesis